MKKKISWYIFHYWYAYLAALICIVIAVSLDMYSPQVTKRIIDDVIVNRELDILPQLLLMIFIIGLGRAIFQYFKEFLFDIYSSKIASGMRRDLFQYIQKLSLSFFDKNNTGELMSRVKDDIDAIWRGVGFISMLIIEVTIHTSIAMYYMYQLSPTLAIIPTIALPLLAGVALIMERKLGKIYEKISEENAKLNTVAQENLSGVRTVKAFAREKFEIQKFLSRNKRYYELNMQQSHVFVKYYPYFQFATKFLPLLVIIVGGYQVINGDITLGTLGAFTEYSMNIIWPMELLGWLSNELASAIASNNRIKKIYNEKPAIIEADTPVLLDKVQGSIDFNNVSFSLGDKKILTDINFSLEAGKTIGIMGTTGTGKTSIINLLQRFYDVSEGQIKLDGVDIKNLSLKQLRENISLVMQDVFLFSDTIMVNMKFGKRKLVEDKEVYKASSDSQSSEFIDRMEQKYETVVGERGVGLSGGQKQRISIARALAKKSPILVLDDSTSALDMETEHLIQQALTDFKASKIVIAHRISAVRNADEILILDGGHIVERGTHDTLLQNKGYYYDTYVAQYDEYLDVNESTKELANNTNKEVAECQ
ncbi:MAG: ABC transporter ATP-binding protein [Clostridiales bacterium]|nr:ABC transporter ATP-binding protein [Clostridiales bacterium]